MDPREEAPATGLDHRQIGPFFILEHLGEGGMGTVYLAEQREPVRRRVALKVLKPGLDGRSFLARFDAERHALSMMEHSCIARVIDAGATASGQPYLAMEYVKGVPITEFCDRNRLTIAERLELFLDVCSGVQHAHTKGVMHRDLKPSNVLVTMQEGNPSVKIIDFGLAKAIDHRLVEGTFFTEAGQIIGTPEYMSPEQAGGQADVDTRTDVYSLGVLLYQLLTGLLPLAREQLLRHGWLEMQRLIVEGEPKKPSTRITAFGESATGFAQARRLGLNELERRLRGDLDWIVMKALAKDRMRRYETVRELSADLQRHLRHEPVSAGPPTAGYVLRKLLRRYRTQVAAAAAVLLALIGGLLVALAQRNEARRLGQLAQTNETLANEALAKYRRLEDGVRLQQFERAAAALVPEGSAMVAPMQQWIADVAVWQAGLPDHAATLQSLRARGRQQDESWSFADPGDQFLHDALQDLVARLAGFTAADGALARVSRSLEWCRRVRQETVVDRAADWLAAAAAIRQHPEFRGLRLLPQEGLVPLGKDPESAHQAFLMPRSGSPPRLQDGRWVLDPETGIVLVLLPGGDIRIGSAAVNPAGRHNALNEQPVTTVRLAPFLIGKYELTQGQWSRLVGGDNPSRYSTREHRTFTGSHPVEWLSWDEVVVALARVGLELPTEPQWEYACRAGTDTEWWFGDRLSSGERAVLIGTDGKCRFNAADGFLARSARAQYVPEAEFWPELDDGFVVHAAADAFEPNPFGLYNVHGNVCEMTRGDLVVYGKATFGPDDGEIRADAPTRQTSIRGGSFYKSVENARSATRTYIGKDSKYDNVGVRVARRLQFE